ncbi:MAG TPA: chemotaxis protein CheW [Gallionellaceae bacterium]|nr:chemotaxis protein CheW [Gallionellaceae bacterium]
MVSYKGAEVDDELHGLIGRMGRVEEYRESLQSLQTVWDNLTLLGYLSGTGADMSETRGAFQQLTGSLLNHLGRETLKKTVLAMKSKAQVAVDIMIRNLFERTADIGFLAMDGMVRDYLKECASQQYGQGVRNPAVGTDLSKRNALLLAHFREYARKYSVYSNILLLDTEGNVLLQLDEHNHVTHSNDPLVRESLATNAAYVETFRKSDLAPRQDAALIYSCRVADEQGENLGVLCLNFRFANETERIFANLSGQHDWSAITLLDREGRVIASSDHWHIPVGAKLAMALDGDWKVVRAAGREYLAVTRATQGYQGYMGPGWYGQVMMPLDHAFEHDAGLNMSDIPADALHAVMSNPNLFGSALREIPVQAACIQRGLNRSVWNGNVSQRSNDRQAMNPAFSKVLLWEISNTGQKTQNVFECSIGNLHQMVVSSILQDSQFQAALAIDIMDRNLYERANDCRWWALAPVFRNILSSPQIDEAARKQASETLAHINSLYTVYDNLVLFDRTGVVVAVSNPSYRDCCGQQLGEDWVRQTLQLTDSQDYAVSPFAPTPLYRELHTYIYAAAVFDPTDSRKVVGGIGIVFDSAPQFDAMLNDALPRDEKGEVPPGCFGVFAERNRRVLAATLDTLHPGDTLEIDEQYFRLNNGHSHSGIAVYNGHYYAVGASVSKGYREYKSEEDAYRNDVVALVLTPLGEKPREERHRNASASRNRLQRINGKVESDSESVEIATFYVDNHWLGIESRHVVEAVDTKGLTSVPGSGENMLGYLMFRETLIPIVALWGMLGQSDMQRAHGGDPQIVVIELKPGVLLGVMVDELGEIPEIPAERIEKISGMLAGSTLSESLVKPDPRDPHSGMIVVISPERLQRSFLES